MFRRDELEESGFWAAVVSWGVLAAARADGSAVGTGLDLGDDAPGTLGAPVLVAKRNHTVVNE